MIAVQSVYVLGRGFVHPMELSVGDRVYTLDNNISVQIEPIESVESQYINQKINRVYSGSNNSIGLDDARYMYYSNSKGIKFMTWEEIPLLTPNKEAYDSSYLPVLSALEQSPMRLPSLELDGLARSIAVGEIDIHTTKLLRQLGGLESFALIDLLDTWMGTDPGKGGLRGQQVKARKFSFRAGLTFVQELARVAAMAGYTSQIVSYGPLEHFLLVNHESMPTPGSIPKTQKYYREYYTGYMYNINAKNRPIFGLGPADKHSYMPTASILQGEV